MDFRFKRTPVAAAIAAAFASAPMSAQETEIVDQQEIEEIVVTGSRIRRTDLTAPSPLSVISAEQIAETGTVTIDSILNEMPQVMPGWTNSSNFPGTGTATVDLRGLGARRTLVLVNGKRYIPTTGDGVVDIAGIPTPLVARIEVMTGGASAVYGSDAIAGVVNFILDDQYEGFELGGSYDLTTDYGDGDIYSINAKFGVNSADDRGNITVFAGYTNRSAIIQGDRPYTEFALDDKVIDGVPMLVPGGSASTEYSTWQIDRKSRVTVDGVNPRYITFDNGEARAWNDPQDRYNYAPPSYLQVPQERFQTHLFATHEISQRINVSLEAMYMHHESDTQYAPQPRGIRSRDRMDLHFMDNPFLSDRSKAIMAAGERITDAEQGLPTGDGIARVGWLGHRVSSNGPRRQVRRFDVWRTMFAVDGEINPDWEYEIYYSTGSSSTAERLDNRVDVDKWKQAVNAVTDPATGQPVCLDRSGGCQPVNIWGKDLISKEAIDFVRTAQNFWDIYDQQTAGLTFVGDLPNASLEAGPIGVAYGVEWRKEHFRSEPDSNAMIGDANRLPTDGGYDVTEAFAEINIPLLANSPGTDYLAVNGAARLANYSTVGDVSTWKYGFEWSPSFADGLRFRGGQQRSIRAPNVVELFAPEQGAGLTIYQDPCDEGSGLLRNAEQQAFCDAWGAPAGFVQVNGTVSALRNSNANLEPEVADTYTAGFVYQPVALSSNEFALTADYFNIDITDAVAPFGGGVDNNITSCFFSLDLNSEFCSNVIRDFTGQIDPINSQLTNVSLKKVSGVDLQMDVAFDMGSMPGRMNVFFLSTYQFDNGFQGTEVLPFIECAGKFGVPCGGEIAGTASARWQNNTRFTWRNGAYQVALNWRWIEGMTDARIERVAAFGLPTADIIANIPPEAISTPDYNYVDISGVWQINDSTTLRIGLDNAFAKEPPLMGDAQIQSNTEPGTYDVLGRRLWVNFDFLNL